MYQTGPDSAAALDQQRIGDVLQAPWFVDTLRELGARQRRSLERVGTLRAINASSPVFWPFHAPPLPICAARAAGGRLWDVDGNEYVDCHLGWGAQALHGHNPPEVVAAVSRLLGAAVGNGYFVELELRHSELLRRILPCCEKLVFCNSGTDATFAAIRLARARTGRRLVAKLEGGLHGIHDLAMHNTAFWYHGYPGVPFPEHGAAGVARAPALHGMADASDTDLLVLPHDERALVLLEQHRHQLACVIAEPVSSSFPYEQRSIPFVRHLALHCRELRIPFILDEVLTGFRCGISGAAGRHDIPADLITYGKVISALGLPLAAVAGKAEYLDIAQTSGMAMTDWGRKTCLNTTHMGNHLALAASHATLELLLEKGDAYYDETRHKVQRLRDVVTRCAGEQEVPLQLVGFGDFVGSFTFLSRREPRSVREFCLAVDPLANVVLTLLLRKRGVYTFSMPLFFTGGAHGEQEIDFIGAQVVDAVREMKQNHFPFVGAP
jgi:glutamate-1-semialdehyde 2,1-aminomutase